MKLLLTIVLCYLLAYSCSGQAQDIDFTRPPTPDWPKLDVFYHYGDIRPCTVVLGITTIACASPTFSANRCDIYLPAAPVLRKIVLHEQAHCDGYDHYGDSIMHDAWERYKKERASIPSK